MCRLGLILALIVSCLPLAQAAPVFTDLSGQPRAVDDYLGDGKWRVVVIWASDCPVCNAEAYQYVDFHLIHQDDDARVLGISIDGPKNVAAAKDFVSRHEINFPNLIAAPDAVAQWYGGITGESLRGTPTIMLFDPAGELQARQAGAVPAEVIEAFIQKAPGRQASEPGGTDAR